MPSILPTAEVPSSLPSSLSDAESEAPQKTATAERSEQSKPRTRIERHEVDGVLLLDKPAGLSSTSALGRAKFLLHAKKAGHTGTLDPFATGLLPLCFGEATKFARFMLDAHKSYRATLVLGGTSTTGDTEGQITQGPAFNLTIDDIRRVLGRFVGKQLQTPPMHSALKVGGVPLYKMARKGIEIAREARQIEITSLSVVEWRPAESTLVVDSTVSKGTYIRVLAEDIGAALGCGAYLTGLRRAASGGFSIDQAVTLEQLEAIPLELRISRLLPPATLCTALQPLRISEDDARIFSHGGWVTVVAEFANSEYQVFSHSGRFLGIGQVEVGPLMTHRLVPSRLMALAT
jgi:tRNA pseudouridine55 synthase